MKNKPEILYEDTDLLLLNKPPGVLSVPDRQRTDRPNLRHLLERDYGEIFVVHRLDRETSGAICYARNAEAHRDLSLQFQKRTVRKVYYALVDGVVREDEGSINASIGESASVAGKMTVVRRGKSALTDWKVVQRFQKFSLLEVVIHTGRTHQIRVHLAHIGHPLAVDELYGHRGELPLSAIKKNYRRGQREERGLIRRLSLHAHALTVRQPSSGQEISVEAPLPKDFAVALRQLERWGK